MLRAVLRSSWLSVGSFLACIVCLYYIWQNQFWLGEWQSTVQAVSNTLPLMLPVIILCAAFDARRLMGSRSDPWPFAPVKAVRRRVAITVILCLPAVIAVAVLLASAAAASAAFTELRNPGLLVLVLLFLWPVVGVALGIAMARWAPTIVTIFGSILFGFVVPVIFSSGTDSPLALLTPIDNGSVSPPQTYRQSVVFGQCLLLVGVIASLIVLAARRFRAAEAVLGATGLLVALSATLVLHDTGATRRFVAENAVGPKVCGTGRIEVCVWSDHEPSLSSAEVAASRVAKALPAAWQSAPVGWMEDGLARPPDWQVFSVASVHADSVQLTEEMSDELTTRLYCGPASGGLSGMRSSFGEEYVYRVAWLMFRADALPRQAAPTEVQSILELPVGDQERWWLSAEGTDANCR